MVGIKDDAILFCLKPIAECRYGTECSSSYATA